MADLDFFTAVNFGNQAKSFQQSLLEAVDSYFNFSGRKAFVIPGHACQGKEGVILKEDSPPFLITAIKVISFITVVIPLFAFIAKVILRSSQTFHIIDLKQKLEEGIDIPEVAIQKIQGLMPEILNKRDNPEIKWYARRNNLVFSLNSAPGLIFKMGPPHLDLSEQDAIQNSKRVSEQRFENMIKAQEVCLINQLGLLVIPHAKILTVAGRTLIAEERFNIQEHPTAQQHLYQELDGLNETVRQIANFIRNTGFSDVECRNMPIIDDDPQQNTLQSRRVALVDLEEMRGVDLGISGGDFRRSGLIQCLASEEQIDIVLTEVYGNTDNVSAHAQAAKTERLQEIENDKRLKLFYERNGILQNPRKPISVEDLDTLGLNLLEKRNSRFVQGNERSGAETHTESITLAEAVTDVINEINDAISKTDENASIKGKRSIVLNTNQGKMSRYNHVPTENQEPSWLRRIIDALINKGHLFELRNVNGHGYFLQA